jgi:hypothetical protein
MSQHGHPHDWSSTSLAVALVAAPLPTLADEEAYYGPRRCLLLLRCYCLLWWLRLAVVAALSSWLPAHEGTAGHWTTLMAALVAVLVVWRLRGARWLKQQGQVQRRR